MSVNSWRCSQFIVPFFLLEKTHTYKIRHLHISQADQINYNEFMRVNRTDINIYKHQLSIR